MTETVASPDGTPIAYRTGGSGEPLLLVHGSAASSADWIFVVQALRDHWTVVTMDRRGRGASGDGPEYSLEREVEDVLSVLDATGARRVVAHSMGAAVSIHVAARTQLERLVIYEPPVAFAGRFEGLEELIERGDHERALEAFLSAAGAAPDQLGVIRSSAAWPDLVEAVTTLPRELAVLSDWRYPPGPLDVPALLVLGELTTGRAYLDALPDLERLFPNLRRATLAGQHHIGHLFAANAFAALVDGFLRE